MLVVANVTWYVTKSDASALVRHLPLKWYPVVGWLVGADRASMGLWLMRVADIGVLLDWHGGCKLSSVIWPQRNYKP